MSLNERRLPTVPNRRESQTMNSQELRDYREAEERLVDLRKWLKDAEDLPDDSTLGDSMRSKDREVRARQASVDHTEGELESIRAGAAGRKHRVGSL